MKIKHVVLHDANDLDYLKSLVRMDIRKKVRSLQRFAPKEGQKLDDALVARHKIAESIERRRKCYRDLEAA